MKNVLVFVAVIYCSVILVSCGVFSGNTANIDNVLAIQATDEMIKNDRVINRIYIQTSSLLSISIDFDTRKAYYYNGLKMRGKYSRKKLENGKYGVKVLDENKINLFCNNIKEYKVEKWNNYYFSEPPGGTICIEINFLDGKSKTIMGDKKRLPNFKAFANDVWALTGVDILEIHYKY